MFKPTIKQVKLKNEQIRVREISAAEQNIINAYAINDDKTSFDNTLYNKGLVASSICDKDGVRLYTDEDFDRIAEEFSTRDFTKLILACVTINGFDEDIEETVGK